MIGETPPLPDPAESEADTTSETTAGVATDKADGPAKAEEIGGREGLDPTRYGDWEKNGRCIDF
ncbi:MAG: DUF1674 domain-containing protein [Lysobacter sp.]|nr:DUF1674 domain-containing protein [Lysobacter sp.]